MPPSGRLLGWRAVDVQPGHVRVEYTAREEFYNPAGNVQGGILAAMLDETMGPAALSALGENEFPATLEMKVAFISPARAGRVIAEGHVLHGGRSVLFLEGRLMSENGTLIASESATARIVPLGRD